jgi:hypothetical protein
MALNGPKITYQAPYMTNSQIVEKRHEVHLKPVVLPLKTLESWRGAKRYRVVKENLPNINSISSPKLCPTNTYGNNCEPLNSPVTITQNNNYNVMQNSNNVKKFMSTIDQTLSNNQQFRQQSNNNQQRRAYIITYQPKDQPMLKSGMVNNIN